jgi:hypothetical protein
MISSRTFDRSAPVQLMGWLCHRHGFGTYLHYIPGVLDRASYRESLEIKERLVRTMQERRARRQLLRRQEIAAYPRSEARDRAKELHAMIAEGRLLISDKNVLVIATDDGIDFERLVQARSDATDLVLAGFTNAGLRQRGADGFRRFPALRDVLFVSGEEEIDISG